MHTGKCTSKYDACYSLYSKCFNRQYCLTVISGNYFVYTTSTAVSLPRADGVRKYLILGQLNLFYAIPVIHWFKLEMIGNDAVQDRTAGLRNNPLKVSCLVHSSLWKMIPSRRNRFWNDGTRNWTSSFHIWIHAVVVSNLRIHNRLAGWLSGLAINKLKRDCNSSSLATKISVENRIIDRGSNRGDI